MKNRLIKFIAFIALALTSQLVTAQSVGGSQSQAADTVIGYNTVINQLINGKSNTVRFSNQTIDLGNFSLRKIDRFFKNAEIDSGRLILNKSIEFHNCRILGKGFSDLKIANILLNNCEFDILTISNLQAVSLRIDGGKLKGLRLFNSAIDNLLINELRNEEENAGSITLFKTRIDHQLVVSNNQGFEIINIIGSELEKVKFTKNKSEVTDLTNNLVKKELRFEDIIADQVMLRKNTIEGLDSMQHNIDVNCDKLVLIDNTFNAPVQFADSKIATRLEIANNVFKEPVDFHDASFPEFGKYVPYSQFKKGFVVYKNLYGEDSPTGTICYYCELYRGETEEELADKTNFDKLVQSYEIMFLGYKSTGDIESANLSYIQIKDLYLNRLGYLYHMNGGFKHYFRWKLAQLLKFYTNHGTDPALSIGISIYVILIFAVFYFFFPSEWDVTSKARLVSDFRDFIDKNDKGRVKPFLTLAVGFGISIINAITLSLNSFVTLGFGTIPTTGAARYVCILQGFIGWFLLSIFTVSLINQILF
jgi:hypothetical protein